MKILFNKNKIGESFKTIKTKIKNLILKIPNDSIIQVVYRNGTTLNYKVLLSTFKGKKNSYTNVKLILK